MYKKIILEFLTLSFLSVAYASEFQENKEFVLWMVIISLVCICLLIIFFASKRINKLKKIYKNLKNKQHNMEKKQNMLLTSMSENIHNLALKTIEESKEVLHTSVSDEKKEEIVANAENRLLGVTNDLISFLQLKSEKIEIVNEEFNLNNVLNEVAGNICQQFSGSSNELIFDIAKNVPRRLIGDSLAIEKIIQSIFEYQMSMGNNLEIQLEITMFDTHSAQVDMQFKITDTSYGMDSETRENIFQPYYDEVLGEYVGLGLFVSHELVNMMDGLFSVESLVGRGNTFTLSLPLQVHDKSNKRRYRLPRKDLIEKNVLIVDDNYNAALAIKKMFAYFRHEVTVISEFEFEKEKIDFSSYDIVILNQNIFDRTLVSYIHALKEKQEIRIISLSSLLKRETEAQFSDGVIDAYLSKPLNQERVFEVIISLYEKKEKKVSATFERRSLERDRTLLEVHKTSISETPCITQESFSIFRDKKLLIVEDNFINQKVLSNILNASYMDITIVNNGKEAVDIVNRKESDFDIILMDINMPIMDGYTATEMIRRDKRHDKIAIVAFTALVLDSEIDKMFYAGINAFLSKPLNIGKLYTAFSMYLSSKNEANKVLESIRKRKVKAYEGIDILIGIGHSNHSEALYIELLKEFNDAYGQSDLLFSNLVTEHRYAQIKMLCLDMKGLTGTIGATDMHVLVTEISLLLLYKKEALLSNYKKTYAFEIKKLRNSIELYLSDVS